MRNTTHKKTVNSAETSGTDTNDEIESNTDTIPATRKSAILHTRKPCYSKVDLNLPENARQIPASVRQVIIIRKDNSKGILSKMNPLTISRIINNICGEVEDVIYKRSGSLIVNAKTFKQVETLLKIKKFSEKQIPIETKIAWGNETSQGKISAPEFLEDNLDDLLEM